MSSTAFTGRRAAALWLGVAALGLALSAAAALSALGPLLLGLHLARCELGARRFLKVGRLEDLLAADAPLGQALSRLHAAESRAQQTGAQQGLAHLTDGFYFDERDRRGRDLNEHLVQLLVARRQFAYDFDLAVRRWTTTLARRDVARMAALLFICSAAVASFSAPSGLGAPVPGSSLGDFLRLAGSIAALVASFGFMRLMSRAAAQALVERLSEAGLAGSGPPHAAAA